MAIYRELPRPTFGSKRGGFNPKITRIQENFGSPCKLCTRLPGATELERALNDLQDALEHSPFKGGSAVQKEAKNLLNKGPEGLLAENSDNKEAFALLKVGQAIQNIRIVGSQERYERKKQQRWETLEEKGRELLKSNPFKGIV